MISLRQLLFIVSCLVLSINLSAQQKRLEFNLGSSPSIDAIHAGVNFSITREFDIGFGLGTIPDGFDFNNHTNFGFEAKYKFGESKLIRTSIEVEGKRKRVRLKTWYGGLRVNFLKDFRKEDTEKRLSYITPTIGRHFNINKSLGLNIDFGLSFTTNESTVYSGNDICRVCFTEEHPQFPLLPTLRIQFFARL